MGVPGFKPDRRRLEYAGRHPPLGGSVVTVTDAARTKILELLSAEGRQGLAVRFATDGRGPVTFRYRLGVVGPEEKRPDDMVVDAGGFEGWGDAASANDLNGSTLDHLPSLSESGLKI